MYIVIAAVAAILIFITVNISASLYYKTENPSWKQLLFHSRVSVIFAAIAAVALGAAAVIQHGKIGNYDFFRLFVITTGMALLCVTDMKEKKLPNKILGILLVIWLVMTSIFIITDFQPTISKVGTALFGCFFCLLTFGITYIISKKSLGGGDVKLSMLMGLYLGSERIVAAVLYGAVFSALFSLIGLLAKKITKKTELPFGPFLFAGTVISLFIFV
ncbi:MAG: prepilin peptidase [Oscillospiraceae bacterium]|nr:prepilin peptidase [Oscillospiraceae bacterium]